MSNAPFAEPVVRKSSDNPDAIAARNYLQKVLGQLDPKAGKVGIGNAKANSYIRNTKKQSESLLRNPNGSQPGEE